MDNLRQVAGLFPVARDPQQSFGMPLNWVSRMKSAESIYHLAAAVGVELVVNSPIHVLQTNLHETEVLLGTAAKARRQSESCPLSKFTARAKAGIHGGGRFVDRAAASGPVELCVLEIDGRIPGAGLCAGTSSAGGDCAALQYGGAAPDGAARDGAAAVSPRRSGQPLKVHDDGRQTRCFCYVRDTVEALVRLQNCPAARGEVFSTWAARKKSASWIWRGRWVDVLGSKSAIEFVSYQSAYAPGFEDMRRRKPVVEKLFQATGFRPATPLRKIIQLAAASMLSTL